MSSRETAWICRPWSWTSRPACTLRMAGLVSDALNDARSIATRPSSVSGARSKPSAQGTRSASRARRCDLHHPGDDPGVGRGRSAHRDLHARRPADAQHEVVRDDLERERLRLAARDGADRQLQPPRRDVAHDDRARRVPASALPDPEAERRRLRRDLADRRRAEPERPGADGGRGRAARLRVADEQAVERRPVEARPHLREERSGAGDRRRRAARAVDRAVERRAVGSGARLGGRERDPGRGDVRLDRRRRRRARARRSPRPGRASGSRHHVSRRPRCRRRCPRARAASSSTSRGRRDDDDRRGLVLGDAGARRAAARAP